MFTNSVIRTCDTNIILQHVNNECYLHLCRECTYCAYIIFLWYEQQSTIKTPITLQYTSVIYCLSVVTKRVNCVRKVRYISSDEKKNVNRQIFIKRGKKNNQGHMFVTRARFSSRLTCKWDLFATSFPRRQQTSAFRVYTIL